MSFESNMQKLGITLPEPENTIYDYIPLRMHRGVVYLAGQIAKIPGGELYAQGRVGEAVDLETAQESARICILQGLAWLKQELGDLDRVESVLRIDGYVAAAPDFERISEVVDAASGLLNSIFGDAGRHPRSVLGMARLPRNAPVLIEMTLAIKD